MGKGIFYWLFATICIAGYFKNIYEVTQCDFEAPYKCEAIHGAGVFLPLVGVAVSIIDLGK